MSNVIEVKNLEKNYRVRQPNNMMKNLFKPDFRAVHAVKNVSFSIAKGEAVAFLGPNGAGKTTTIKMMTGLICPTAGIVEVLGFNPFLRKNEFLRRIGLVMGNKNGLNWDLTANQSFRLIKNIYDLETTFTKNRINELAELLDVSKLLDTQMRNLSLGERMKMELIGSILHNPEVLFLDEPTIGLDILTKKRVRTFLREIQQRDKITLILTSHDIDDIEAVCDRVIIINKGEKCFDDSIETLISKYHQNRYLRFVLETALSKEQIDQIKQWGVLEKNNKNNDNTYLFKTNTEKMIPLVTSLLSENKVLDMQIESVPLEDVVADLFKAS